MENNELTSQLAQISTVSGIEKLNTTLGSISGQIDMSKAVEILREMPVVKEITENTTDLEFVFDGSEEMLAEILKRLVESGIGIVSFREKEGNLEEIFMQVTGGAGV